MCAPRSVVGQAAAAVAAAGPAGPAEVDGDAAGCNADADAEGVAAAGDVAAEAGAGVDAVDEAGALEVTGLVEDDEEAGDEVHPATPAPATTAAAPAAARRLASLVEPNIANPHSPRPRRRSSTMSRNLAVYTPFRDDVRLAMVSGDYDTSITGMTDP
jgi:hypothetical protein